VCGDVSKIDAEADVEEADRADLTDVDPEETVALYVRVSTEDQNLDRQQQLTYDYATDRLGVAPSLVQVYADKRSGTNTDRSGYADLMVDLEAGAIDRVVVSEVSRLSRSVRDFAAAVERIVEEHGAALHVLDMGLDLDPDERDPYTCASLSVAATFAELEADIKRENTRQGMAAAKALGKQTGRPPFGFDISAEGYLSPNDDFETALVILDQRDRGDSKQSVANSAGVPRRTVGRIENRCEIYESQYQEYSSN
jgi:DNA invertase Pin-like site-specific DNA recombinase